MPPPPARAWSRAPGSSSAPCLPLGCLHLSTATLARVGPGSDVSGCQDSGIWIGTRCQPSQRGLEVEEVQRHLEMETVRGGGEVDAQELLDPGCPVAPGVGMEVEPSCRGLDAEVALRQGAEEGQPGGAVLPVVGKQRPQVPLEVAVDVLGTRRPR